MPETQRRSLRRINCFGRNYGAGCEEKKTLTECFWWVLERMTEMLRHWVDSTAEDKGLGLQVTHSEEELKRDEARQARESSPYAKTG